MTGPETPIWTDLPSDTLPPPQKKPSGLRRPVGPGMIIAIIIGVVLVRGWLMEGVIVGGNSMEPTLKDGEWLLALKCRYGPSHLPARGDIVIFPDPQEGVIVVKRVIALPEEEVIVYGAEVAINGRLLQEPYAQGAEQYSVPERVVVPKESIWVMGDNRDDSVDSRTYGPVKLSSIRGRPVLVMWPFPPRLIPRAQRMQ